MEFRDTSDYETLKGERDQLLFVYRTINKRHLGGLPLPPEELRLHVGARTSEANFLAQGSASAERVLNMFGTSPEYPILDWGCGSGRTWRWLQVFPEWRDKYFGCDVDVQAIEWLRSIGAKNLSVCTDEPNLPFKDAFFNGLFAFSVLTHIPPENHASWYREIRRVLRPGARAYLTTQGERIIMDGRVSKAAEAAFFECGATYVPMEGHYKSAALVSETYTRAVLDGILEILEYRPSGYQNMDVILVKSPDS